MKYFIIILVIIAGIIFYAYKIIGLGKQFGATTDSLIVNKPDSSPATKDTSQTPQIFRAWPHKVPVDSIVTFAETLQGVPYLYASTNPSQGFDCSGFITYVFNHFGLDVPRTSADFTHRGIEVSLQQAKRGDLILFTGTDSTSNMVGHMGIITQNADSLRFIHASSGKANGVTITALNPYYQARFVKIISVEKGL